MSRQPVQPQGERWWIHGPTNDETLHSVTERAWRCYGADGHTLRRRVWPRATVLPGEEVGLDGLSAKEVCALARAIGVPPRELFKHRLPDHPMLLQEDQRRAYCPSCWQEDARAGHPPSFRRAWTGVFTLNCSNHGRPLHWASTQIALDALQVNRMPAWPSTPKGRSLLRTISRFALIMQDSLEGRTAWPAKWRGDAYMARALLMRAVVNLGRVPEHPPFASIGCPPELSSFIGTPPWREKPLQVCPWERVRALGPPSWRRAALWITACYVISSPGRPPWPEGLPFEPFAALDAQWNDPFVVKELQRVQRYRRALQGITRAFTKSQNG